jgi:hypothetical protein
MRAWGVRLGAAQANAQAATATSATSGPRRPSSGAYLGIYSELPGDTAAQSVSGREQQLGRKFAIDSHYYNWTDNFPGTAEKSDAAAGRIPMITWWGTTLSSISNGSEDTLIKSRAAAIKAFGKPVFLRWGAEMNGNWFAWSGPSNGNNPAAFVAAWKHIHDVFAAAGVTNVSWVWAPNADSKPGGTDTTSWNNWRHYYPGDNYVDWVGIDGYNWGSVYSWQSPQSIFGPVYGDYASKKPIMIAETSSVESGGSKAGWISSLQSWMSAHPAAAALIWFDTNTSSTGIDWRIDSSTSSMNAFKTLAHSKFFAH